MRAKSFGACTLLSIAGLQGLVGCASMTPTTQTKQGYTIYDIKAGPSANAALTKAIVDAMKEQTSNVRVVSAFPPPQLPAQPGRFKMASPFGANLGVLAASSGQDLSLPTCDNATLNATAAKTGMASQGENTIVFACLIPYQGGYGFNIVERFTITSGGYSPDALGKSLARSVIGDSSQFIPKTIAAIVTAVKAAGFPVTQIEDYPLQ